jgi:hypothetical protein
MPGDHTRGECHTPEMIEGFETETRMSTIVEQLTDRNLVMSLQSTTCPSCGGTKKRAQTFCGREYLKLPQPIRKALYARLGSGYRESVAEALAYLQAEKFRLPPAGPQA